MRKIKGLAVLLFTVIAALVFLCAIVALPKRLAFDGGERYTFYVGNTSKNCHVVSCKASEAALTRLTLQEVCGESATFSYLDVDEFLDSVNGLVIFVELMEDSINYYCTADLPYSVDLYGIPINLHICVREDSVTVGSPIIFGGY